MENPTNDPVRTLIAKKMGEKRLSETALSKALGLNAAYVNQYLKYGKPKALPEQTRYKVAEILEIDEKILRPKFDFPQKDIDLHARVVHGLKSQFGSDMVPVLGVANGSSEALVINFNEPVGDIPRHPNQAGMKGAFALYARGESMWPRYKAGDPVYVIANKPPTKEQDCIIELKNGESFLKEFIKQTPKEVICHQFNPDKEWKRPLGEVRAIHAVVGRG